MKRFLIFLAVAILVSVFALPVMAQCSICTRTAEQLGEKPAQGLNAGILYLALMPFAIVGIIGYRWWRKNGRA